MKGSAISKWFLATAAAAGIAAPARADFCYPFDTNIWEPPLSLTGPIVWSSAWRAIQVITTNSGWNIGSVNGVRLEFCLPTLTNLQAIANAGCGRVSFDLFVNADSFQVGAWADGDWYQIHYAGNSDGVHGWTQDAAGYVATNYYSAAPNGSWHFDLSFAQLGWEAGDTWFQVNWGGNSIGDDAVQFFIDNVCVHCVPGDIVLKQVQRGLVLSWTNSLFTLQSAPEAGGAYTNVPGATSPYPARITGSQQFFRLKY